jgi:hypothetical protein
VREGLDEAECDGSESIRGPRERVVLDQSDRELSIWMREMRGRVKHRQRGGMILCWTATGVLDAERTSTKLLDIAPAGNHCHTSRA